MHITRILAHRRQRPRPVSAARHRSYARPIDPVTEQFGPVSLGTVYPEAALMCAVLEDAFRCFRKQIEIERGGIRPAREAEKWFFSDNSHELFSFVSICTLLELEPEFIRHGLKHWAQPRLDSPPSTR
jgi:hypothetical protein